MDLLDIRKQLDELDTQLVELYEKRMELCAEVAESKIGTGKAVYDKERELQKLEAVKDMAHGDFNQMAVGELFSQIMTISRRYQYRLLAQRGLELDMGFTAVDKLSAEGVRVVYQGVEGAYSHAAVYQFFGSGANAYHVPQWEDAMKAVQNKEADYAVLPIENSSAGAVTDNYDLLVKYQNYIVGETQVAVSHALLSLPDAEISDIRTVFSHPQALMQCSQYLNEQRQWRQISVENTAVAAKKVLDDGDKSQAAVASEIAGRLYNLKVLKHSINYNKNNTTRFIIVSREAVYRKDATKVSICFELPHISGSLYNMLGNFIFNHVNMMKIESRPILGRNWEYRFFVDIEGNLSDAGVRNALKGIEEEASNLRILGNY